MSGIESYSSIDALIYSSTGSCDLVSRSLSGRYHSASGSLQLFTMIRTRLFHAASIVLPGQRSTRRIHRDAVVGCVACMVQKSWIISVLFLATLVFSSMTLLGVVMQQQK